MSVQVIGFGCRLNAVESEAMAAAATQAGGRDLVIVNTCAVTAEASRQARQAIRRAARANPDAEIVVTGCASEVEPELFRAMPEVARLVPNAGKTSLSTWGRPGAAVHPSLAPAPSSHTRAFIEIQNGCDHRCTFCIIPFGRGASRSVPPERVISAVQERVAAGTREAVLTGVDITSYAAGSLRLGGLVKRLLGDVPTLERLRLSSIDCIEADADLRDAFASEPRLMPHLHLSLQSGADLILKRMRRRHGRGDAIRFCRELREVRPGVVFGADLIVGFPTETEDHFRDSLALVEECGLTHLHVFPFSPRPGTPAARMPPVAGAAARERAARLRALGDARVAAHLDRQVGRTLEVLTERGGRGRGPDFTPVRLPDATAPNLMLAIRAAGHDGRTIQGDSVTRSGRPGAI